MYYLLAKTSLLLSRLKVLLPKTRRLGLFSYVFLSTALLTVYFSIASSAASSASPWTVFGIAKDGLLDALSWIILLIASLFMKITVFMLSFVIEMGGYNGFIDSDAVKVGWVMVRDIANMFFVVILLVIAFATILGIESYEWKKLLPKFILAAILVNFSRVICGLIIDAAQVVMITFINGVAATAGGNLISFFNLDKIQKLNADKADTPITRGNVFMASVGGLAFAAMAMAVIAIYVIILVARIVVLWILIVLSPLAFVLSVIPHTQKYASQWWTQFGGHVIVGPVLAFFLWLSFVSLSANTEGISKHIADNSAIPKDKRIYAKGADMTKGVEVDAYGEETGGISKAMTWDKMANFAIAIGMLVVGAKAAQQTGAVGGGMMAGAINFGKRVISIASGVASGLWLAKGAGRLGVKGLKRGAYIAPFVGGEKWERFAKRQWEGIKNWRLDTGMRPVMKRNEKTGAMEVVTEDVRKKDALGNDIVIADEKTLRANYSDEEIEKMGLMKNGKLNVDDEGHVIDSEGNKVYERETYKNDEGKLVAVQAPKMKREKAGYNPLKWVQRGVHRLAISDLKQEKLLEKTEGMAKVRRDLLKKRIHAKPTYLLQSGSEKMDGLDRIEQGMLEEENARSEAKTKEFKAVGRIMVSQEKRWQDNQWKEGKPTIGQQKMAHLAKAEAFEAQLKALEAQQKADFYGAKGGHVMYGMDSGKDFLRIKNTADHSVVAAEELIKGLVNEDLDKAFKQAANKFEKILDAFDNDELSKDQLLKLLAGETVGDQKLGAYERALANAAFTKMKEEDMNVRKKQANDGAADAFVNMPYHGYLAPSTALSDLMEVSEKEMAKWDREEGYRNATDIMIHMMKEKEKGNELSMSQRAHLMASSRFLKKEAWVDDKHGYMTRHFQLLKDGKLEGKEKDDWKMVAENFHKLGWLKVEDGGKLFDDKDNLSDSVTIDKKYARKQARDLEALAVSGLDFDLVDKHNQVEKKQKEIVTKIRDKKKEVRDEAFSEATKDNKDITSHFNKKKLEVSRQLIANARKQMIAKGMEEGGIIEALKNKKEDFDSVAEELAKQYIIKNFSGVSEAIREAFTKNASEFEMPNYWKIAEELFKEKDGVVDDMKKKFKDNYDFLQLAVRDKSFAHGNGHIELGGNVNFDNSAEAGKRGLHRFTTVDEGEAEMRADRVKMDPNRLLSTDQYHSYGPVDQVTSILDDFNENTLRDGLGRVAKAIQLAHIPERTGKGLVYLHKNENAEKTTGQQLKTILAVIGGASAKKKFINQGHTTTEAQTNHMLEHGLSRIIHSDSGQGWAFLLQKIYGHIDDLQAQHGIINIKVGDYEFESLADLAREIQSRVMLGNIKIEGNKAEFIAKMESIAEHFDVEREKYKKRITQAKNKTADASGDTSAEDEQLLQEEEEEKIQ